MSRPVNPDRQRAIEFGLHTYIGLRHVPCGTSERYVAGGICVRCARVLATEQREALKYLKQRSREEAELDTTAGDAIEDDAEARRQASIDELM